MENLFEKYNKALPRYTSYPAVPHWNGKVSQSIWIENVNHHLSKCPEIDIYIHIPYCQQLCWYCGCNREIAKSSTKADPYIQALKREWLFLLRNLTSSLNLKIKSIHLGGGTPTFLSEQQLDELLSTFEPFLSKDFIGAIEIDPRTLMTSQLVVLKKYNFSRASLGIQDFDEEVQKQINRIQSFSVVEDTISKLRQYGFTSINFDLIYGLPAQTVSTIEQTISRSLSLNPDLISFYSYAHLPERIKNQRLIKKELLSSSSAKRELYEAGRAKLLNEKFIEIGLDHFAKKGSYLEKSLNAGKLQRSFMGYTDKKSDILIGLGASSISNTTNTYKQNEKEVREYIHQISKDGEARITTSHLLSDRDIIQNKKIQELMCTQRLSPEACYEKQIIDFIQDGLLAVESDHYRVTKVGNIFLRNICAIFDEYLEKANGATKFSQSV